MIPLVEAGGDASGEWEQEAPEGPKQMTLGTEAGTFVDQIRINTVRDALWGGANGASVMVGSGFSRNAELKLTGRSRLPDWEELVRSMFRQLHPNGAPGGTRESPALADPLAIAQDYCNEFGRLELDRFLRERIRDDEVEPGEYHKRLLGLPWSDVFTTNWDTLLERTAQQVATPSYGVVRATNEIPLVQRPRIVKLHGSLPANLPLVITKCDFDRYPKESAAFVNTARQAMMETVFLLLGFSGDDPNFLRWSKWVRNELRESAPKVYLAGWLEYDKAKRQELERSHVMPIDLAQHPKSAYWRAHGRRHEFALEWILASLEAGQPYPVEEWPKALPPPAVVPAHLEPVDRSAWNAPKGAVALAVNEGDDEAGEANVDDVVAAWECSRGLYPGWLALPERTRRELLDPRMHEETGDLLQTNKEDEMLGAVDGKPLECRLRALHEIVWRREIRLEAMGARLAQAAEGVLAEIATDAGDDERNEVDRTLATRVALALVTEKRLAFDKEGFQNAVAVAAELGLYEVEANHRLNHEKCLMALYETDEEALRKGLSEWEVGVGDPFWGVRKAALMFEGDQNADDVLPLLRESIEHLRGAAKEGSGDMSALSREAWASYLAKTLESRSWSGGSGSSAYRRRARHLARFNCDPDSEIGALSSAIEDRAESDDGKGPGFDLGGRHATRTLHFGSSNIPSAEEQRARTAYRVLRLAEVVGLPSLADRWPPTKHMLGKASEAFYRNGQVELALRLMLRTAQGGADGLLKRLMSRPRVASLSKGVVESVVLACERTISYHRERGLGRQPTEGVVAARERVGAAMECLSRLVLRLNAPDARRVMRSALACYETRAFYEEVLLRSQIRNLLTRSWEALPEDDRADFVVDLLNAPVVGLDGFSPNPYGFFDPGELLDEEDVRLPPRDADSETDWARTVQFLVRGLGGDEEARSRAMRRMCHVAMSDRLVPQERDMVAAAIWQGIDGQGGPAGEEKLRPWVFFCMPQPTPGTAMDWFRGKWLAGVDAEVEDPGSPLDQALHAIGDTKELSASKGLGFDLAHDDEVSVLQLLRRWSETPVSRFLSFDLDGRYRAEANNAVRGVTALLMYIDVPDGVANGLVAKCSRLDEANVSPLPLLVALSRSRQDLRGRAVVAIRKALLEDDPRPAGDAAAALQGWLHFANRRLLDRPPDNLVREIGAIVETRRSIALPSALWVAEWVFVKGQEHSRALLRGPVIAGLAALLPLLRYQEADTGDSEFDVPLLRWRCVGIARALQKAGCRDEPVLAWIDQGLEDRLPEVRRRVSELIQ